MASIRLFLLGILLAPLMTTAQDSTETEPRNEISGSINYQSALHFFGRVDSLRSSGLFPVLGFQLKNGLYAQGSAVFVQNPAQAMDYTGASVELGFKFPDRKHFEGNVFVSKFFYEDQSMLVQSALRAQTGINLSYKNKIVNLNAGADLKFSDRTDVGATLGVDHLFVTPIRGWDKAAFAVMPSATLSAGTQHFSNTYIKKETFLGMPVSRQTTEETARFSILAYEFSAPLVLVAGKFNAFVVPAYVIPQNLLESERGRNLFYVTAGLGFRL